MHRTTHATCPTAPPRAGGGRAVFNTVLLYWSYSSSTSSREYGVCNTSHPSKLYSLFTSPACKCPGMVVFFTLPAPQDSISFSLNAEMAIFVVIFLAICARGQVASPQWQDRPRHSCENPCSELANHEANDGVGRLPALSVTGRPLGQTAEGIHSLAVLVRVVDRSEPQSLRLV